VQVSDRTGAYTQRDVAKPVNLINLYRLTSEQVLDRTVVEQRWSVRKRSLSDADVLEMRKRVAAGEKKAQITRDLGISRETLYQYLREKA